MKKNIYLFIILSLSGILIIQCNKDEQTENNENNGNNQKLEDLQKGIESLNKKIEQSNNESENNNEEYLIRVQPDVGDYYYGSFNIVMSGPMSVNMEMDFWQDFISVDRGQIECKMGFKSAKIRMEMGGNEVNYDSDNPYANEASTAMHAEMAPLFSADGGMIMDDKGKVLKEYGWEELGDDNFSNQMGLTNVEYPEEAMKIGDSFNYSTNEEEGMTMNATYTLDDVSLSEYVFTISGEVFGNASGKVIGGMIIYRESGMPKSAYLDMDLSGGGESMNMTVSIEASKR